MSEYTTFLKIGATSVVLRMLEEDASPWRDLTLENPIRAIREISHDLTCRRRVRLANGRELSAIEIQTEYLNRALRFAKRRGLPPLEEKALRMWEHAMIRLEDDPLSLDTEVDWVIKYHMIEAYRKRHDLPLTHPRIALLDLSYHDVTRARSLYYLLERRGHLQRTVRDSEIDTAVTTPPQTTRARLRGAFIKRAKERKRDYTVDWVHLKLNDQAQRTVLCKDPFKARDDRVERDLGDGPGRAYVLTQLTGTVAVGDRVVVNTTAVELGLGTGGWHVVHWNLERDRWAERGPGHIIKGRYTSLQADVGSAEEHLEELAEVESIDGLPVVAAALHSQLPAAAVAFKERAPDARLAYVMTDGAGLPLALSDLAFALRERELIDATITCGHAFGGDYEAVSIFSALAVAKHVAGADAVVVSMGPGIVGTNTRLGFSGMEVGWILDAAAALDGQPIACLRVSFADPRSRHVGLSHHTQTALRLACRERVAVAVPRLGGDEDERLRADLAEAGIDARHDLVDVTPPDVLGLLAEAGLDVVSMGRPAAADPALFLAAGAAGVLAAERARPPR